MTKSCNFHGKICCVLNTHWYVIPANFHAFEFLVKTSVGCRKQKDHDFTIEFFDSARGTCSRVIALVDSMWAFLLLSCM